jgi:hypothetical protein
MGEMGRLRTDVIELKEPPHDDVELLLARAPTSITLLRVQGPSCVFFTYLDICSRSPYSSCWPTARLSKQLFYHHRVLTSLCRVLHARLLLDRNKMTSLLAVGVSGQVVTARNAPL